MTILQSLNLFKTQRCFILLNLKKVDFIKLLQSNPFVAKLFHPKCNALWNKILRNEHQTFSLLRVGIWIGIASVIVITFLENIVRGLVWYVMLPYSTIIIVVSLLTGFINSFIIFPKYYYVHLSLTRYLIHSLLTLVAIDVLVINIDFLFLWIFGYQDVKGILSQDYIYRRTVSLFLIFLITFFYVILAVLLDTLSTTNEQIKENLSLLKTQLNPHFFFNALNNIYSYTYIKDDRAPEMVMQLSHLMRFMLYETDADTIPLAREVEFLQEFIALQEAKYHEPKSAFELEIQDEATPIPPLLLLPLVENCFKHGEKSKEDFRIKIRLVQKEKQVLFITENTCAPETPSSVGGIGLKNLSNRLSLLYPDRHQFTTEVSGSLFKTNLTLMIQ